MTNDKDTQLKALRQEAEAEFLSDKWHCSEAVVLALKNHVQEDIPTHAISMASGFAAGIGQAHCVCGAVVGGVMCLGYAFGRTHRDDPKPSKASALARELYDSFMAKNKAMCCRTLIQEFEYTSPERKKYCSYIVGDAAEMTAEILLREMNQDNAL